MMMVTTHRTLRTLFNTDGVMGCRHIKDGSMDEKRVLDINSHVVLVPPSVIDLSTASKGSSESQRSPK